MPETPEHLEALSDLIDYLDHIALGVHDLRSAARLFELLGGTFITGPITSDRVSGGSTTGYRAAARSKRSPRPGTTASFGAS